MNDIFLTDKCVLLIYPNGASGKFLLNALSLNSAFVYQNIDAVLNDTPEQRFKKLIEAISNFKASNNTGWNDLLMGDLQFFGVSNFIDNNYDNASQYQEQLLKNKLHAKCLQHFIKNEKYFFRTCHYEQAYLFYRNVWPNCQQVLFYNCERWINTRNSGGSNYMPKKEVNKDVIFGTYFDFDAMSFASKEQFISEYASLLLDFNLQLENEHLVALLYDAYTDLYFNRKYI